MDLELVKQHHKEILDARNNSDDGGRKSEGGSFGSRTQKRRTNAVKRNKKKLKTLEAQISAAGSNPQSAASAPHVTFADDADNNHAGNAFGGRKAKRDNKSL